jgi:hypothetical protein
MRDLNNDVREPAQEAKLAYVTPDLVEAGMISDVTLSNGNNSGADAAYS